MKDVYYLNGIDWVMAALDHATQRRTGIGTYSQVVLDLSGTIPVEKLKEAAAQFSRRLPVLHGRISRSGNLAPYWKVPSRIPSAEILACINVNSRDKAQAVLEKAVNTPFARKDQHLCFYALTHPQGSYFSLVFDHLLLDARGAETLLAMFNGFLSSAETAYTMQTRGPQLSAWKQKFSAGRRVNRFFLDLGRPHSRGRSLQERASGTGEFVFRHHTFDLEQSRRIAERADEKAGYLMFMPYALAAVISAMPAATRFGKHSGGGAEYLIPVNLDTRSPDRAGQEVFFNHVSFLFFRIRAEETADMDRVLDALKKQLYEQVKSGFFRDLEEASLLTRIVPARLLRSALGAVMRENDAAFAFSYNASGGFTSGSFMGVPVQSVFHTPRVPVPPGKGVFFTRYGDRLSVVFSYLRGMLEESEADSVMAQIRARLLGESDAG